MVRGTLRYACVVRWTHLDSLRVVAFQPSVLGGHWGARHLFFQYTAYVVHLSIVLLLPSSFSALFGSDASCNVQPLSYTKNVRKAVFRPSDVPDTRWLLR